MSQNYTPTEWIDNRTVGTASVMNNMEKGIKDAHDKIDEVDSQIKENKKKNVLDFYTNNFTTAFEECFEYCKNNNIVMYVPPGNYEIKTTLNCNRPVTIEMTKNSKIIVDRPLFSITSDNVVITGNPTINLKSGCDCSVVELILHDVNMLKDCFLQMNITGNSGTGLEIKGDYVGAYNNIFDLNICGLKTGYYIHDVYFVNGCTFTGRVDSCIDAFKIIGGTKKLDILSNKFNLQIRSVTRTDLENVYTFIRYRNASIAFNVFDVSVWYDVFKEEQLDLFHVLNDSNYNPSLTLFRNNILLGHFEGTIEQGILHDNTFTGYFTDRNRAVQGLDTPGVTNVSLFDVPVKNLIRNGDFSSGTLGFKNTENINPLITSVNHDETIYSNVLTINNKGYRDWIGQFIKAEDFVPGARYSIDVLAKVDINNKKDYSIGLTDGVSRYDHVIPKDGKWHRINLYYKTDENASLLRLDLGRATNLTFDGEQDDYIYIANCVVAKGRIPNTLIDPCKDSGFKDCNGLPEASELYLGEVYIYSENLFTCIKINETYQWVKIYTQNSKISDPIIPAHSETYQIGTKDKMFTEGWFSKPVRIGVYHTNNLPMGYPKGVCAYDNTNNKPVWFNGTYWHYADGTRVK